MAGYDNLQQIASVLKSNGTDGELVMSFRDIAPEDINLQEPVFIIFDGLPVPFFIESFTKRGNSKALVRLTDICSMEDVEEIAGKAVYIDGDSLPEMTLEDDGYAALVGWTLLTPAENFSAAEDAEGNNIPAENFNEGPDEEEDSFSAEQENSNPAADNREEEAAEFIEVGEITDFIDIPNNPCLEVETINGAVMIPLHEDLIISVDPEYQELIMQIPAGLL